MSTNLERYRSDLKNLLADGTNLLNAIQYECYPERVRAHLEGVFGKGKKASVDKLINDLPEFSKSYQKWYSEAKAIIKQLLPDRLVDFSALYEKPKNRKSLDHGTYVIADYLQSLVSKNGLGEVTVDTSSAIPQFTQQLEILKSVERQFESSLFEIKQLVQADLFDSELEIARELQQKGFSRAAGAITGVILEKHLQNTCKARNVKLTKKDPTISVLNDTLKEAGTIDIPTWRFIQRLSDLRNLCDHNKTKEPTKENISDLIDGVDKITKTVF